MKHAKKIALGGLLSALSCVLLMMAGMMPFLVFAMPMLAGMLLVPVCAEMNWKWGYAVYAVVSVLSLLLVADREAAFFYIGLFGHYAVTKMFLERIRSRPLRMLSKLLVFAASVALCLLLTALTFGLDYLLLEYALFGAWSVPLFGGVGLLMLGMYDVLLSRLAVLYEKRIRPKIRRML